MVRNSLRFVSWKDEKAVAAGLKKIYQAATVGQAERALDGFAAEWDGKYPSISKSWKSNWPNLTHFFGYPPEIRKVIYTTNAIESMNRSLRKIIKAKGAFPNDDAVLKVLYLALRNASGNWKRPIKNWKAAINLFAIEFEGRVPLG
jgi:transposase-like protein